MRISQLRAAIHLEHPKPAAGSRQATISISELGCRFGPASVTDWVFKDLNLEIESGQFCVLLGPSGCGKTTLLRMMAGLIAPTTGTITTGGRRVEGPGPDRAMVFQSVETPLMGWLTARQNVEFGLRLQGRPRKYREEVSTTLLKSVGLLQAAGKYPHQLSGGMKQRVQIARVLSVRPEITLMDEPFAALDSQTRSLLQEQLVYLWRATPGTIVYVTHDIREAVLLGERIIVLGAGPSARVRMDQRIDLSYPRDEFSDQFGKVAARVRDSIVSEVQRTWLAGSS